jgi:hypothetical protein
MMDELQNTEHEHKKFWEFCVNSESLFIRNSLICRQLNAAAYVSTGLSLFVAFSF